MKNVEKKDIIYIFEKNIIMIKVFELQNLLFYFCIKDKML